MLETNTRQGTFTTLKECMNAIEPSCAWIQKQQNSEHWFHANGINCPSKILKQWPPSRQKNAMTRALSRGGVTSSGKMPTSRGRKCRRAAKEGGGGLSGGGAWYGRKMPTWKQNVPGMCVVKASVGNFWASTHQHLWKLHLASHPILFQNFRTTWWPFE